MTFKATQIFLMEFKTLSRARFWIKAVRAEIMTVKDCNTRFQRNLIK